MSRVTIVIDIIVCLVFAISIFPNVTGVPIHEWIGILATVILVVHCAAHGAIRLGMQRKDGSTNGIALARTILNVLVLAALATCAVSGIMVSGTVLLSFDLFATGYYLWDPLHAISAKVLLALLLVHIAINARAFFSGVRRDRRQNREDAGE